MSESTVRDLFRSLEQTLHERLRVIEDVLIHSKGTNNADKAVKSCKCEAYHQQIITTEPLIKQHITEIHQLRLELQRQGDKIRSLEVDVEKAGSQAKAALLKDQLLPTRPMAGIEVVMPAKIVQVQLSQPSLPSLPSQPLEEVEEEVVEEVEEEVVEEVVEEVIEEAEETVEAEEAEETEAEEAEEAEGLELEEFEYKGKTYYRDAENNVYVANEDGEVDAENPIGTWNALKQRILPKAK